jgi:hypothetical protein
MTSAYLDRSVDRSVVALLASRKLAVSLAQKQDLAAVIHLCGARTGDAYARNNFRLTQGQRCGEHEVRAYLVQVNTMKRLFARLSALR